MIFKNRYIKSNAQKRRKIQKRCLKHRIMPVRDTVWVPVLTAKQLKSGQTERFLNKPYVNEAKPTLKKLLATWFLVSLLKGIDVSVL